MSKKILLADDSVTIQKVISITLSIEDYDLVIVGDGDAAVKKARETKPDVILADIAMPGKNGYEVCDIIKNDPELRHIPVMLLAGTFEPLNKAEAERCKADDSIVKPFEAQELIDRVRDLVIKSDAAKEAAGIAVEPLAPPVRKMEAASDIWESGEFMGFTEEPREMPAAAKGVEAVEPTADFGFLDDSLFGGEPAAGQKSEPPVFNEFMDLDFHEEEKHEASAKKDEKTDDVFGGFDLEQFKEDPAATHPFDFNPDAFGAEEKKEAVSVEEPFAPFNADVFADAPVTEGALDGKPLDLGPDAFGAEEEKDAVSTEGPFASVSFDDEAPLTEAVESGTAGTEEPFAASEFDEAASGEAASGEAASGEAASCGAVFGEEVSGDDAFAPVFDANAPDAQAQEAPFVPPVFDAETPLGDITEAESAIAETPLEPFEAAEPIFAEQPLEHAPEVVTPVDAEVVAEAEPFTDAFAPGPFAMDEEKGEELPPIEEVFAPEASDADYEPLAAVVPSLDEEEAFTPEPFESETDSGGIDSAKHAMVEEEQVVSVPVCDDVVCVAKESGDEFTPSAYEPELIEPEPMRVYPVPIEEPAASAVEMPQAVEGVMEEADMVEAAPEMVAEEVLHIEPIEEGVSPLKDALPTPHIEENIPFAEPVRFIRNVVPSSPDIAPAAIVESVVAETTARVAEGLISYPETAVMPREEIEAIVRRVAREVVEEVVWEIIPDMAEELIKAEIKKFKDALSKLA